MKIDRYENERTHTKVETQSFHRAGENKIKFGSCCCNTTYLEYPAETCSKSRNRDRVTRCQTLSSRGIGSKGLFFFEFINLIIYHQFQCTCVTQQRNRGSKQSSNSRQEFFCFFILFYFFSRTSKRNRNYFFHSFSSVTITITFPVRFSVKISHLSYFCDYVRNIVELFLKRDTFVTFSLRYFHVYIRSYNPILIQKDTVWATVGKCRYLSV